MPPPDDEMRRWRTTAEQFERQYCSDFGKMSGQFRENWERVKAMQRDGDEWYGFSTPDYAWQHLAGCQGVELVRDGKIVERVVTVRS